MFQPDVTEANGLFVALVTDDFGNVRSAGTFKIHKAAEAAAYRLARELNAE